MSYIQPSGIRLAVNDHVKMNRRIALTIMLLLITTESAAGLLSICTDRLKPTPTATDLVLQVRDEAVWARLTPSLKTELENFTKLSSTDKTQYLKRVSAEFATKYQNRELGAHYNLHGGVRRDYIDRGGISFSMGDSGLEHGYSRDARQKVYFFNLKSTTLFEVLDARNPSQIYFKARYGNILTIFDVKAVREFLNKTYPGAIQEDEIVFSLDRDARITTRAVPSQFYASSPLLVFQHYAKRLGRRLSWDDETLVTMRLIDAHLQTP